MKKQISVMARWLALAVFLLVAGCFYRCGSDWDEGVSLTRERTAGQELSQTSGAEREPAVADVSSSAGEALAEPAAESTEASAAESASADRLVSYYYVHVCGEVQRPGVYPLQEGERICDAIEQAGGFTEQAAGDYLNLAQPVLDGMKIQVPTKEQALAWQEGGTGMPAAGAVTGKGTAAEQQGKVNINTATKEELMTLRGIGEARAEDIIRFREEQGGFGSIEDIMGVSGIKDAAFQKIQDDITV